MTTSDALPPCHRLPAELKIQILQELPTLTDLRSAALSSRAWYETFKASGVQLQAHTLFVHELGGSHTLYRDVLRNSGTVDDIRDIRREYPIEMLEDEFPRTTPKAGVTSEIFFQVLLTHRYVCAFADAFCRDTLRYNIRTGERDAAPRPATREEMLRVVGALYRFGLIGRIVQAYSPRVTGKKVVHYGDYYAMFVTRGFSPWEIEEIKIVGEYIHRILVPRALEFAIMARGCRERKLMLAKDAMERDYLWMCPEESEQVELAPDVDEMWMQYLTTLPLPVIFRIAFSEDKAEVEDMLSRHINIIGPDNRWHMLWGGDYMKRNEGLPSGQRITYERRRICLREDVSFELFNRIGGWYERTMNGRWQRAAAIWDDERLKEWGYFMPGPQFTVVTL